MQILPLVICFYLLITFIFECVLITSTSTATLPTLPIPPPPLFPPYCHMLLSKPTDPLVLPVYAWVGFAFINKTLQLHN